MLDEFDELLLERLLEEFDELLLELLLEEFEELFPAEWRSGSACRWTNWSGAGVSGRASAGSARAIAAAADKVDILSLFIEFLHHWNRRAGWSPARSKRNLGGGYSGASRIRDRFGVGNSNQIGAAIRRRRPLPMGATECREFDAHPAFAAAHVRAGAIAGANAPILNYWRVSRAS